MNKKRGRPRSDGHIPAWMFLRTVLVINIYNTCRSNGMKHDSAIAETVVAIRQADPQMPISESEVRRTLAKWQPKEYPVALQVSEMTDAKTNEMRELLRRLGVPCSDHGIAFSFGIGPRHNYPRVNAKSK